MGLILLCVRQPNHYSVFHFFPFPTAIVSPFSLFLPNVVSITSGLSWIAPSIHILQNLFLIRLFLRLSTREIYMKCTFVHSSRFSGTKTYVLGGPYLLLARFIKSFWEFPPMSLTSFLFSLLLMVLVYTSPRHLSITFSKFLLIFFNGLAKGFLSNCFHFLVQL